MPYLTTRLLLAVGLTITCRAALAQSAHLDVHKVVFPNGLTLLAMENHDTPSVAYYTVFKVGSRNERPGITGISHLFEHMMFNGSARFKPKQFDRIIEAGGGYSNAFTDADTTEYMEEFSSPTLDTVLQLEADRMRALKLDRANIEQERGIVKEERRVNTDNSVEGSMSESLWNTAFVAHPYRWDTIGFMKDIDAISLADAKRYFRAHYAPNDAVIAVVGDFRTDWLIDRIRTYFGSIPRQPAALPVVRDEPPQRGERRQQLHHAAELPAVDIAYHIGSIKSPDNPALEILASILSDGDSSRLYTSLVYQKQIATSVACSDESRADPGLFTIRVQAQPGHTAAECEAAVYATLDEIERTGVQDREVQRAKNVLKAAFVRNLKTNVGLAGLLAEYEANWGDWKQALEYVQRREAVTAKDVQQAAARYFVDTNRTAVTLVPDNGSAQAGAR